MGEPRLLDCRKVDGRMSSLSYTPRDDGRILSLAAHEGRKPVEGDYLILAHPDGGDVLYRVTKSDWCMNVDPANMWMATAEHVPGKVAATLTDIPAEVTP